MCSPLSLLDSSTVLLASTIVYNLRGNVSVLAIVPFIFNPFFILLNHGFQKKTFMLLLNFLKDFCACHFSEDRKCNKIVLNIHSTGIV